MPKLRIKAKFGVVPHNVLANKNLSYKAKGIYAQIQSKPDGWNFSSLRLSLEASDGESGVRGGLQELVNKKYLVRTRRNKKDGTWEWEYVLYEEPYADSPSVEKPRVVEPPVVNPRIKQEGINKKELTRSNIIPFDWKTTKDKMMSEEGSIMDIIASYLVEKNLIPADAAQLSGYIKRYRKVAADISPFVKKDFNKFWKAVDMCKEEAYRLNYEWSLETVYKKVTKI